MKKVLLCLSIAWGMVGCNDRAENFLPGEKHTIDTLMHKKQRVIDAEVNKICQDQYDGIYNKAVDSLFQLRSKDVMIIRGDGKPPVENNFEEALQKEKPKRHKTR